MDELYARLAPLTDWIPPETRDQLDLWVWWLIELVVVLLVLVVVGRLGRVVLRVLFRRRHNLEWDRDLREDLNACPLPGGAAALAVHHIPARIRLLIVAPGGKGVVLQVPVLVQLLDRVVPGLGAVVQRDRPRICLWPAGHSHLGFTNTFHRCTPTGKPVGEPSHWILLAGRAQAGTVPLFIGLALWTDEPTSLGRLNLEAEDWRGAIWQRPPQGGA
jgi:hypothetical protein